MIPHLWTAPSACKFFTEHRGCWHQRSEHACRAQAITKFCCIGRQLTTKGKASKASMLPDCNDGRPIELLTRNSSTHKAKFNTSAQSARCQPCQAPTCTGQLLSANTHLPVGTGCQHVDCCHTLPMHGKGITAQITHISRKVLGTAMHAALKMSYFSKRSCKTTCTCPAGPA